MISFVGSALKNLLFAAAVLIAGVLVTWEGKPVSEHLLRWARTSGLQSWVASTAKSAESLVRDAREGSKIQASHSGPSREKIGTPERSRLRSLLEQEDAEADSK